VNIRTLIIPVKCHGYLKERSLHEWGILKITPFKVCILRLVFTKSPTGNWQNSCFTDPYMKNGIRDEIHRYFEKIN
jgi:hypothetical protein